MRNKLSTMSLYTSLVTKCLDQLLYLKLQECIVLMVACFVQATCDIPGDEVFGAAQAILKVQECIALTVGLVRPGNL